jgi:hypothetical protein
LPVAKKKPPSRVSSRIAKLDSQEKAASEIFDHGVAYLDKMIDGRELDRKTASMKHSTGFTGGPIYEGGGSVPQNIRDRVNERKRRSKGGGDPCYDIIDDLGSSVYLYSLPTNLIRGLLQGFKTNDSMSQFQKYSHVLASHRSTRYMFLHWNKGSEDASGDWTAHAFVKAKPDLETCILSLGNYVTRKVLINPQLTNFQPGVLVNTQVAGTEVEESEVEESEVKESSDDDTVSEASVVEDVDESELKPAAKKVAEPEAHRITRANATPTKMGPKSKQSPALNSSTNQQTSPANKKTISKNLPDTFQPPHWDFTGWRHVPARDLPWVLHVPLCKEGMMLHVWPTERDKETHSAPKFENFKLGPPKYVHIAFGDAILLRGDVAHGGCFGSPGNCRFHMVLRKDNCILPTNSLHMLEWSTSDSQYKKAREVLKKLGDPEEVFSNAVRKSAQTVTAYISSLKQLYPCEEGWFGGLLDLFTCS